MLLMVLILFSSHWVKARQCMTLVFRICDRPVAAGRQASSLYTITAR
jgi:hypothetical protein